LQCEHSSLERPSLEDCGIGRSGGGGGGGGGGGVWMLRSQCIRLANSSLAVELRLQTLRK